MCKGLPIGPLRGPIGSPSRRDQRVAEGGAPPSAEWRQTRLTEVAAGPAVASIKVVALTFAGRDY
jgi:hypothetical protein